MERSASVETQLHNLASSLVGQAQDESPVETVETVDEIVEETVEDTVEADENIVDENHEDSDESQEPVADENQEVDEEPTETTVDTLNNLAETLDVPVTDLYQLNVNMSEGDAQTLGTLKDFYESNQDIDTLRTQLENQETELQTEIELLRSAPTISNELVQLKANVLSIQSQYDQVDWNALYAENPGLYAAKQQQYNNAFKLAKQNEKVAEDAVSDHKAQSQQMQTDRLLEQMPELKDDKVFAAAAKAATDYAGHYGFTAEEVANIEDGRLVRLLIDASRNKAAKVTAKKKQVKKTVKGTKPAGLKVVKNGRNETLERLTKRAKAAGASESDKMAAMTALFMKK